MNDAQDMMQKVAMQAKAFKDATASACSSMKANAEHALKAAFALKSGGSAVAAQQKAAEKFERTQRENQIKAYAAALKIDELQLKSSRAAAAQLDNETEMLKLRDSLAKKLGVELDTEEKISAVIAARKQSITDAKKNPLDDAGQAAVAEHGAAIGQLKKLNSLTAAANDLAFAAKANVVDMAEAVENLSATRNAAAEAAESEAERLRASAEKVNKDLFDNLDKAASRTLKYARDVMQAGFDFNKQIMLASTTLADRQSLLSTGIAAGIATGQSLAEAGNALRAFEKNGLTDNANKSLQKSVETSIKLNSALGLSYEHAADLAVVANATGNAFERVADAVARIAERTSVSADEAARMVQSVSELSFKFGTGAGGIADVSGISEQLAVLQDQINKQLPGSRDLILKTVEGYSSFKQKGGLGQMFGTGGIDFMSKANGADVAKNALKNEAAYLRNFQDNAAAFESVAEQVGKSAAEARAFIKAVDGMDEATNNFKDTAKSLDQIYDEQSKASGDTFNQLKKQWTLLTLQFSKPLVWLAGVAASALKGINKFIAAIDAMLPKWMKFAIGIPIAIVGAGVLIAGVVIKTVLALSALAASIKTLQEISAKAAVQNGVESLASGGGKVGWMKKAGGMALNLGKAAFGVGGKAAATGAATVAGEAVAAGAVPAAAGGVATAASSAATAAGGVALLPLLAVAAVAAVVGGAAIYAIYRHAKKSADADAVADEKKKLGNVMSPEEMNRRKWLASQAAKANRSNVVGAGNMAEGTEMTRVKLASLHKQIAAANAKGDVQRAGVLSNEANNLIKSSKNALASRIKGERGVMSANYYKYSAEDRARATANQTKQLAVMDEMLTTSRAQFKVANIAARVAVDSEKIEKERVAAAKEAALMALVTSSLNNRDMRHSY